jgi:flagellar protein FlbT
LRQLYFIMQIMLMSPNDTAASRDMFENSIGNTIEATRSTALVAALRDVDRLVATNRVFDAMKALRALFPIEAEIMANGSVASPTRAA